MRFLLFLLILLIFFSLNMQVDSAKDQTLVIDLSTQKVTVPKELPGAQIVIIKKKGDLPEELLPQNIKIERENDKKDTSNNMPEDMKDLLSTPADKKESVSNKIDSNINKMTSEHNNKNNKGVIIFIFSSLSVIILGIIIYFRQNKTILNNVKGG